MANPGWHPLPRRAVEAAGADPRRAAIARMVAWVEAAGARLDGVAPHVDPDGAACLRATHTAAPGSTLLVLPRAMMIVDDELADSASGAPLDGDPDPADALAAWLPLEAAAPHSRWAPFLDTLPRHFDELPMFRAADELAALGGTVALAQVEATRAAVVEAHAGLPAALRARVPLADFAWGRAVVQSRGFNAPFTIAHRLAHLPVVDLFNHGRGAATWRYDPVTEVYVVTTRGALAAGDEVRFDYGPKPDSHLLVHYGFALDHNPDATAAVALDPGPDQAPRTVVVDRGGGGVRDLVTLTRRHACPDAGWATAEDDEAPWAGLDVERAALTAIAAAATRARTAIAPPDDRPDPWHRACSRVRTAERGLLAELAAIADDAAPLLTAPVEAVRAAAARASPVTAAYLSLLLADLPSER